MPWKGWRGPGKATGRVGEVGHRSPDEAARRWRLEEGSVGLAGAWAGFEGVSEIQRGAHTTTRSRAINHDHSSTPTSLRDKQVQRLVNGPELTHAYPPCSPFVLLTEPLPTMVRSVRCLQLLAVADLSIRQPVPFEALIPFGASRAPYGDDRLNAS